MFISIINTNFTLKRKILEYLKKWKLSSSRKPLILRGARQVGKSYVIREFSKKYSSFLEVNFEETPSAKKIFEKDLIPEDIIKSLEIFLNSKIEKVGTLNHPTLLFFDEIQECPNAITALRYFYEKMPELHIIAAGSLLEFKLKEQGIPVGRVEFAYLYPLSFIEFLEALELTQLYECITQKQQILKPLPEIAHSKLLDTVKLYLATGGMPEVVKKYRDNKDLKECQKIQQQLTLTFRQDFRKYTRDSKLQYVEEVYTHIPASIGRKIIYSKINSSIRANLLAEALELLTYAGITYKVYTTSADGIPLGSGIDRKHFKTFFLDVGLVQKILGLSLGDWLLSTPLEVVNKGAIAEQFVAQELLSYQDPSVPPELFYWHREARSSNAEVDFILPYKDKILPLEVKSGDSGHVKSMYIFLKEKEMSYKKGFRISLSNYRNEKNMVNIPIYGISWVYQQELLEKI